MAGHKNQIGNSFEQPSFQDVFKPLFFAAMISDVCQCLRLSCVCHDFLLLHSFKLCAIAKAGKAKEELVCVYINLASHSTPQLKGEPQEQDNDKDE